MNINKWSEYKQNYLVELDTFVVRAKCPLCKNYSVSLSDKPTKMNNQFCSHCGTRMGN